MKKIKSFFAIMALATTVTLTSCSTENGILAVDQYNGDTKKFVYEPSLVTPVSAIVNPLTDEATVKMNNNTYISISCLTPNQPGDAIITEAPIIPLEWVWNQSGYQYIPSGFAYNVKFGFTNNSANVWFMEKTIYGTYILKNKNVNWGSTLNPGQWTSSFRGLSGISSLVMPMTGRIGFGNNPNTYFFSL